MLMFTNRFSHAVVLFCFTLAFGFSAYAQDSLVVKVNKIATNGITVKGKTATFPYPVLTFMTISDTSGNHIAGLADTAAWLGPDDVAPVGNISDLWQPLSEYHLADPSQPADANLYRQKPAPQFLEVNRNNVIPTSIMLMMDNSRSLSTPDLEFAKSSNINFINNSGDADRIGFMRFARNNEAIWFTDDKDSLTTFIADTEDDPGTRIYRALIEVVDSMKAEPSIRRQIILFTDGRNNDPTGPDIDSVLAVTNEENITVHTIGLGLSAGGIADLRKVASETGGLFFHADSGAQLLDIYARLSEITNNFYVMAHTSPEPCGDEIIGGDSTRVVDITVTDLLRTGSATGFYNPPETVNNYDVSLMKTASDNSIGVGETFSYELLLSNDGPNTAFNVWVVDSLSAELTTSGFSRVPDSTSGSVLFWQFDSISPGLSGNISITYDATVNPALSDTVTEISSRTTVLVACDNNSANDFIVDTITIDRLTTLGVTTKIRTDSFTVSGSDTTWFAAEGDSVCFIVTVSNTSANAAQNVLLTNVLPDSVFGDTFVSSDTLTYNFGAIPALADTTVEICAIVSSDLPFYPFPLENTATVSADNVSGTIEDIATAYGIAPPPTTTTLDISWKVQTDSFTVDGSDTTWFAEEDETYSYNITVRNTGTLTATNVLLRDVLPDSVLNAGDTLSFAIGDLLPSASETVSVNPTVVSDLPFTPFPLVNTIIATGDNADPLSQTFTDTVFAIEKPLGPTDIIVITTVSTDTFIVDNGDTTWFAFPGDSVCFKITVRNNGPEIASNVILTNFLPDSLFGATFGSGDTLVFNFGNMPAPSDTTVEFCAVVADSLPFYPYPLDNDVILIADNGGPVTASDTVYALEPPPVLTDISVTQFVETDSFTVENSDTTWYVARGETFTYRLKVTNERDVIAEDVVLVDYFPPILSIISGSINPPFGVLNGDSIKWDLGDFSPNETRILSFDATVPTNMPQGENLLTNRVVVQATNQDPLTLANNFAEFSVLNIVPPFREGCEFFTLDFNVFEPQNGLPLGINFELEYSREATLELLDISGYRVTTLYREVFDPGINRREWDGTTENGLQVGSGTYIVTLKTFDSKLICWKKVIIRR
ncbi:MAG: VWA domain-containing protein [Calditrichia bacterium]